MTGRRDILALIPARGGSKSIPRKNLLPLLGKPLLAYTIEHALASRWITRTIVSTEDDEISRAAILAGAEVPFLRPAKLAEDTSPDIDVFRHALDWLKLKQGYIPDLVVHLRATAPMRRVAIVDAAIEQMIAHPEADSLRSVSYPLHTPYKMWRMENGYLTPLVSVDGVPEAHSMPRQVLPQVFWQNGYVDIIRPATVQGGSMCGRLVLPFFVEDPIHELDYWDDVLRLEETLKSQPDVDAPPGHNKRVPV
jgi:CMP-N,N'-diacetyllegionaminic acid synthase